MAALLKHEDDLHLDLRTLSFRFVFAPPHPPKSPDDLKRYATAGSGTVQGRKDEAISHQIDFWERFAKEGITDAAARASARKFRAAFDELEQRLAQHPYLQGGAPTVLDIAWFIYANRLALAGYPFARLHPRVDEWFGKLQARPEFAKEVQLPPPLAERFDATRRAHAQAGKSLEAVAGF